jgi:hypothetical protein
MNDVPVIFMLLPTQSIFIHSPAVARMIDYQTSNVSTKAWMRKISRAGIGWYYRGTPKPSVGSRAESERKGHWQEQSRSLGGRAGFVSKQGTLKKIRHPAVHEDAGE